MVRRFGSAPVRVYVDRTGRIGKAFGVVSHPVFRFVSSQGRLTKAIPVGFPFR